MENNNKLLPNFLKKLDKKLLLHRIDIWCTRILPVTYFYIITAIVIVLLSFLVIGDVRTESNLGQFTFLIAILSIVFFVIWIIYLIRFNPFKQYAKIKKSYGLFTYLLYLICIGFIVSLPYLPSLSYTWKANLQYSNATLTKDLNTINKNYAALYFSQLNDNWQTKLLYIEDNKIEDQEQSIKKQFGIYDNTNQTKVFEDRDDLEMYIAGETDSVVKLSNEVYLERITPNFQMVELYNNEQKQISLLGNKDLYLYAKNQANFNKNELAKSLQQLVTKYANPEYGYYYNVKTFTATPNEKTSNDVIRALDNGVSNILDKKGMFEDNDAIAIYYSFGYCTLFLTAFVFMYRHTTKRVFFLSILTGFLSMLFIALCSFGAKSEDFFFGFSLFVYFVYFVIAFITNNEKNRIAFTGIALNIAFFFLPIVPITIFASAYINEDNKYNYFRRHGDYVTIGGFLLLLILIPILFFPAYKKWYSKPEI